MPINLIFVDLGEGREHPVAAYLLALLSSTTSRFIFYSPNQDIVTTFNNRCTEKNNNAISLLINPDYLSPVRIDPFFISSLVCGDRRVLLFHADEIQHRSSLHRFNTQQIIREIIISSLRPYNVSFFGSTITCMPRPERTISPAKPRDAKAIADEIVAQWKREIELTQGTIMPLGSINLEKLSLLTAKKPPRYEKRELRSNSCH